MTRTIYCMLALLLALQVCAQTNLSEGASLLFRNKKSTLTVAEKNQIFQQLKFQLSKDKKQFVDPSDETKENAFDAVVFSTDLNKDQQEEVFISYGNTFTSGNTGCSIVVFIKD